jgi:glycosyltransferase involved in cell wall biosynthesis
MDVVVCHDRPGQLFVIWSATAYAGMERALVMAANILSAEHDVEVLVVRAPPAAVRRRLHGELADAVTLTVAPPWRELRRRVRAAACPVLVGVWTVARARVIGPRRHRWVWWEHSVTDDRLRISRRLRILDRMASWSSEPQAVVVPAGFMRGETERRRRRPVSVIPNGGAAVGGVEPVRRRVVTTPVAATLGRLESSRRTDIAIRSLVHLPELTLRVAGDGPDEMALRALVASLGLDDRVNFEGWVADTAAFLTDIDVLLVTSPSETFGYALFEAAARTVPVVACPNPRTREVVPRLVPGVVADGDDPALVAAAVVDVLRRPADPGAVAEAAARRRAELSCDVVLRGWGEALGGS